MLIDNHSQLTDFYTQFRRLSARSQLHRVQGFFRLRASRLGVPEPSC